MKKTKRFHVEVLGKLHDYVITKNGDIYVDFLPFPMQLVYNKQKNRHEVISTFYREAGIKLMSGSLPFCLAFIQGAIRAELLTLELTFDNE
jgi:hypothetical protein